MYKLLFTLSIFMINMLFSQEYCAGDQISDEHQNRPFNVCYGDCGCNEWSLSEYSGDIIFIDMSATWCAPCYSSIDFIDELEEYWSRTNSNVRFVTALSDIDQPYSCLDWGNEGVVGSPLIVEDNGTIFNWFHDSNAQYPNYVIIDHEMKVRAKPSNILENSNTDECDGSADLNVSHSLSSWNGGCVNDFIIELLDECGDGCLDNNVLSDQSAQSLELKNRMPKVDKVFDIENNTRDCPPSYVADCSDDDCCPENWIGDGFSDCEDQLYGCDLSCYEMDGGDCNTGCTSDSACNYNESSEIDNGSCIYADEFYNCCGECMEEVDCFGVCGGDATQAECNQVLGGCPTCLIVCPEEDIVCQANNNAEYPFTNIQEAINFAQPGDTVLVEPGTYYENIIIQKSITLISRAVFDDLSAWMEYEDGYVVANNNINNTILNGSANSTGDDNFQSVILINSPGEECIAPSIHGFTITGGNGTSASTAGLDADQSQVYRQGGGYYSLHALPDFKYNAFKDNTGNEEYSIYSGGAGQIDYGQTELSGLENLGYVWSSSDPQYFPNCDTRGDIELEYNAYGGNDAQYGKTLNSNNDISNNINMCNSFFDVFNCPEDNVTAAWVNVDEFTEVNYCNSVGDECSISDDVYVSVDGDDSNLGTSELQAFRTMKRAMEMIAPKAGDTLEINLAAGTYSPSNGYDFPIIMTSFTSLIGQGEESTILDAEQTDKVISMINSDNVSIKNMTITGGVMAFSVPFNGAGIYMSDSKGILLDGIKVDRNYTVQENILGTNMGDGIGIYALKSDFTILNSKLLNNKAMAGGQQYGGGMYVRQSVFLMNNVFVRDNIAYKGGGMYIDADSYGTIQNSVFYGNRCITIGGGLTIVSSNIAMDNVDIRNNGKDIPYLNGGIGGDTSDDWHGFSWEFPSGGIVAMESNLSIKNSRILENWSHYSPGIDMQSGTLLMQNSLIAENRKVDWGDDDWDDDWGDHSNSAITLGAWVSQPYATTNAMFVNCTFANNYTKHSIMWRSSSNPGKLKFINSILGGDAVYNGGGSIGVGCYNDNKLEVYYSNLGIINDNNGHCVDTADGATNTVDYGCSDYGGLGYDSSTCPDIYDDDDFIASEMCCECGAGQDTYSITGIDQGSDCEESYYNSSSENIFNHDPLFTNHNWTFGENWCNGWILADCEPLYYPNYDPGDYTLQDDSESKDKGIASISQYSFEGMIVEDMSTYAGSAPDLGFRENCDSGEIDLCGVCGGDNSSCADCNGVVGGSAYVDDCASCDSDPMNDCILDECGVLGGDGLPCIGDVNFDNSLNVLDVIAVIEIILCGGGLDENDNGIWDENSCDEFYITPDMLNEADYDNNGHVNVADIVAIIYDIFNQLGRELVSVDEINLFKAHDGLYLESSGFVALDIILSHDEEFEYSLTNDAFIGRGRTLDNLTRMIVVHPTSDLLFNTDNLFVIEYIEAVTANGNPVTINMVDSMEIPGEFTMSSAYPNPFNPITTIQYNIPYSSNVKMTIYDVKGREVAILVDNDVKEGYHSVKWNAYKESSGIYFIRMNANDFVETQKLILIK